MEHPNARRHLMWSLAKSSIRILAGGILIGGYFVIAGILIIIAEMLGIAEEIV